MKIMQIAAPTTAGGLERVVEALAIGHHELGHEVSVATLLFDDQPKHPFVEMLRSQGVTVHPLRMGARSYLEERRAVSDLCREVRPDVVHTHGYRIDLLDRKVVADLGIPTVTTVHGASMTGGLKGAFFEWMQRRNYRKFDAVVAVSSPLYDATLADGVAPDRLHLIANAWSEQRPPLPREEAREALGLSGDRKVVGWVGRLIPVKGADVFLEALGRLPSPRPIAVIIGYGMQLETLRARVSALHLDDDVRFYPDIRDAGRYFRAFDTYVLSSRSEGLPIVVLEAMAAGTPIVATRVGGVPDALSDGAGWLPASENPAELAEAIHESITDRAEAEARAARAGEALRRDFALDAFLERYEAVYRGVQASSD